MQVAGTLEFQPQRELQDASCIAGGIASRAGDSPKWNTAGFGNIIRIRRAEVRMVGSDEGISMRNFRLTLSS